MPGNEYCLVVELPKSDGVYTVNDHHLASIAKSVVRVALLDHDFTNIAVRVEKIEVN